MKGNGGEHGDVRRTLLRCALDLFSEKGVAGTAVREIVRSAGVTKPTLYYHFGSKEGLVKAVVEQAFDEYDREMMRVIAEAGDAREAITAFVNGTFRYCTQRPEVVTLVYSVVFEMRGGASQATMDVIAQRHRRLTERVIGRAVDEGLIPPERAEAARVLLGGLVNIHILGFLKGQVSRLDDRMGREAVTVYLEGAGRPGPVPIEQAEQRSN